MLLYTRFEMWKRVHYRFQSLRHYSTPALLLLIYLVLATASAHSSRPNNNEAWFADPALELIHSHSFGTPILDGTGTWLAGIDRYTYWTMPLYALAQALWYLCFGFSLFTQRALTEACGVIVLLAIYVIVRRLVDDRRAAYLAVLFTATDFSFIELSGMGRMDMMCAAFGLSGLAIYLHLRERNYARAILWSNVAIAAGCLTHPCGVLALLSLIVIALYLDRKRIGWRELAIAAVPYAVGLAAWGIYIAQAPSMFLKQLLGNVNGMAVETGISDQRFNLLLHPRTALKLEIMDRYVRSYNHSPLPLIYLLALPTLAVVAWRSGNRKIVPLLLVAMTYFSVLTFAEGFKRELYLVHIVPILAAVLATLVFALPLRGWKQTSLCGVAILAFIGFQLKSEFKREQAGHYRQYLEAVEFLKSQNLKGANVIGTAEVAYDLGFNSNLVDDVRLGYYSGKTPDALFVGRRYTDFWKHNRSAKPELSQYIERRLSQEYVKVYENPAYQIYVRRSETKTDTNPAVRNPDHVSSPVVESIAK